MNRRTLFLLSVLVVLLGLLGYVLYAAIRPSEDRLPVHARRQIPNTDLNPYGANFFLEREVEAWKREETVRMAYEAGIGWAKQQFIWAEIEPQPGQFRWTKYDAIVDLCESYGLQIIARLDGAPNWSRQDNSVPGRPPDNLDDYGAFVYRFVEHYRGRIGYVQVWNEPNLFIEWGNRPVDPAGYVELLKTAYQQAKGADPNTHVLSAPLAITLGEPHPEPGKWRAMSDLQYLEEMYKAGAAPYFDILSANAFGMDLPPDDPPSPSKLNFARVRLQREIMERYGDDEKAIWFNEYGWNAAPESFPEETLIWKRVTEEEQASFTLQGIEQARQNWPWVGVFNIWYFRQVGNIHPEDPGYYFRMVDVDWIPRRVYFAVQDRAAQLREAGPGYYEETHPAVYADPGRWITEIDRQSSGQAVLASETPGSNLTFTFRGDEVSLEAWFGPEGGQLLATLDGEKIDGLALDERGRSYVDLYAPEQTRKSIVLYRDGNTRRRTLRLAVSEFTHSGSSGHRCIIDGFQVRQSSGQPFPLLLVLVLLAGCMIIGWLFGRARWRHRPTA
ncbi:MAG: beta-galactosidase [Anaerolineae bacterium]|nr:beta-galactosidase [Anaerolineae bacterium]